MDVREKLIEIVKKAAYSSLPSNTEDFHLNWKIARVTKSHIGNRCHSRRKENEHGKTDR